MGNVCNNVTNSIMSPKLDEQVLQIQPVSVELHNTKFKSQLVTDL